MAMVEEAPIISRINHLDNVVKHLEEMSRGSRRSTSWESSSSTGSPSTCSDGRSSESFMQCRPLDDVVSETQHKGTLLFRLSHLEDRVLELCLQLEKEMEQHVSMMINQDKEQPHTPTKKGGLKQLVKSCVRSKSKSKSKSKAK